MNSDQVSKEGGTTMPIKRLVILSDVIFALSMTLIIFAFELPAKGDVQTSTQITAFFLDKLSIILIYFTSFILIAVYWIKHLERFSHYKKTDQNHLWLEIFYLILLALMPLANGLSSGFPNILAIEIFYSLIMFFMGLFSYFSWRYATKNRRLVDADLDEQTIISIRHESLVEPIISLLAIAMAFIYPDLWEVTLLLIPVFFIIQQKFTKKVMNKINS